MATRKASSLDGIDVVHQRKCSRRGSVRCNCNPSYRVQVWDPRARKLHRKTFRVRAEAITWRDDVRVAVRNGTIRPAARTTVGQAADALVAGMADGTVLGRKGKPYKPSSRRSYAQAIDTYLKPDRLARMAVSDVRRADVQDFVDTLRATGRAPSTIRNAIDPLRVIFRRARQRDEIAVDPTKGVELPSTETKRDRIASPAEGATLIEALPAGDRALWATAMYAGLRRGELRALPWSSVDLDGGVIRVEWGWDDHEGRIAVKSDAGRRRVPIVAGLRRLLIAHKLATGRDGDALVFGRTATMPFDPSTVRRRALRAWGWRKEGNRWIPGDDASEPIGLHECRHTFASLLIAAGENIKAVSTYMGHASVTITLDLYGHLLPGSEAQSAVQLGAFLDAAMEAGA
jgi:integrase